MRNSRYVKKFYDLLADSYDELYGEEQRKKHAIVLRALLGKKGLLLDLGCGTGELSIKANKLGWSAIAADISLNMLKVAKRKGVEYLVQCSFDSLPFRSKSFDIIAAISVFSSYSEFKKVADKLREIVKPPSLIIISIPKKARENDYDEFIEFQGVKDAFLFLRC